jgi:hypothetical protein
MPDIFVSHSSRDRAIARNLYKEFVARGDKVFVDRVIAPGKKYREEIDDAIRQSKAVVVLVSPDSCRSTYVVYEWSYALGADIALVPVLVRPTPKLHPRLEAFQYIDAKGLSVPQLVDQVKDALRRRRHVTSSGARPEIYARFQMAGDRLKRNGVEYVMDVGMRNVPPDTKSVRYEIVDDPTVDEPVWKVTWKRQNFEDEVSLHGEVYLLATGKSERGDWRAQSKLSEALRRNYGARQVMRSSMLTKAIHKIASN